MEILLSLCSPAKFSPRKCCSPTQSIFDSALKTVHKNVFVCMRVKNLYSPPSCLALEHERKKNLAEGRMMTQNRISRSLGS
jgi:hypothetical protein